MNLQSLWRCICFFLVVAGCSDKRPGDPCCTLSELPRGTSVKADQGALQIDGSTSDHFYVLDEEGKQVGSQSLNVPLVLDAGRYQVRLNNFTHSLEVKSGMLSKCSTGTLIVSGNISDTYYVMDSTGRALGNKILGKSLSLFPGTFIVSVNNAETPAAVRLREMTEIRTGTINVRGTTGEYYYVLKDGNEQLNYNTLEKPLAFLPGSYLLKVNNTSMKADVYAGKVSEFNTGNVLVKGLTEEYYYVTDTLGNALNYQTLNKALAFFPGKLNIKVNNTITVANVSAGKTTEYVTGSLMLTGGGTGYYYVLDETGNQLNYNSLNKSLSFFPSEYIVKLGSNTRKATVTAGELTALDAFN